MARSEESTPRRMPVVEQLDPAVVRVLQQMTPAQRLAQAFRLWKMARITVRASIRQEHPEWTEEQVLREAANRLSHGATERVPR